MLIIYLVSGTIQEIFHILCHTGTAAARGYECALRALLRNGTEVNGIFPPHYMGNLLLAFLFGVYRNSVQILDKFGVDFNLRCYKSFPSTALETMARYSPHYDILGNLLEKNSIDVNLVDSLGRTVVSKSPASKNNDLIDNSTTGPNSTRS
jgi:hypothetical protein